MSKLVSAWLYGYEIELNKIIQSTLLLLVLARSLLFDLCDRALRGKFQFSQLKENPAALVVFKFSRDRSERFQILLLKNQIASQENPSRCETIFSERI